MVSSLTGQRKLASRCTAFLRLAVDVPMDRPSRLFDYDIDSTRQLAQTLPLPEFLLQLCVLNSNVVSLLAAIAWGLHT